MKSRFFIKKTVYDLQLRSHMMLGRNGDSSVLHQSYFKYHDVAINTYVEEYYVQKIQWYIMVIYDAYKEFPDTVYICLREF